MMADTKRVELSVGLKVTDHPKLLLIEASLATSLADCDHAPPA